MVGGRRAHEHVLAGAAREQLDVEVDVARTEGHEVDDGIELAVTESGAHGSGVADVGVDLPDVPRERSFRRAAAIEDRELDPPVESDGDARRTDRSRASDEQR